MTPAAPEQEVDPVVHLLAQSKTFGRLLSESSGDSQGNGTLAPFSFDLQSAFFVFQIHGLLQILTEWIAQHHELPI